MLFHCSSESFRTMIYPQDFRYKQNNNVFNISNNEFDVKSSNKIFNLDKVAHKSSIWIRYCTNSTVHGLRYLAEPKVKANERYKCAR